MNTTQKPSFTLPVLVGVCIGISIGLMIDQNDYSNGFINTIIFGTMGAISSFFLEFCYQEGNIFGWWLKYLDTKVRDNKRHLLHPFYKPLGGCIYCHNIWIAIGYFMVGHFYFGVSWWMFLPVLLFSHLALTVLDFIFWRQ